MGDLYNTCSSSSRRDHHRPSSSPSDDISLFLHQILLHSSSSSASTKTTTTPTLTSSFLPHTTGLQSQSFTAPLRLSHPSFSSGLDSYDGLFSGYVRGSAGNNMASCLSVGGGNSENETDDQCDCESESGGVEALLAAEEMPATQGPPRGSSKRSRAAEVHNLSEKRRRSRINEKMKALQNLIPNSNKTDKASMLDEAIEYLKQLQLQVQMLSMRNGMSLHPMCLPGVLQTIQLSQFSRGFGEENASHQMNIMCSLPLNQENQEQVIFDLPSQCAVLNQLSVPSMINSEASFGVDSSIQAQFGSFPLRTSPEELCREDILPHQQVNANHAERIASEFEMGPAATASLPFETEASNLKDNSSLGACVIRRSQNESVFLKNMEHNLVISSNLQGLQAGRSSPSNDEIKIERKDIWNLK